MAAVRAVLWDADGVLQQGVPSWPGVYGELLGDQVDAFGAAVWGRLEDALAGRFDMAEHVNEVIGDLHLTDRRDAILDVWGMIDPLVQSREVVRSVRGNGTSCYLATNQDTLRASHMRSLMEYDDLLDGSYYSCELGVAKPAAEFFFAVAEDLGMRQSELLFVDDQPENVAGARAVGLRSERWHHTDGIDALTAHLAAHGIHV